MSRKVFAGSVAAGLTFVSQTIFAQPFNTFDPVSMAMGGVGVALPIPTTANLYNPSLLSSFRAERDEDFAIGLSVGVRAYDQDELLDLLDDVADDFDNLEGLVDQVNLGFGDPASIRTELAAAARRLDASLTAAHGKSAQVELGGALLANLPRDRWAIGLTASGQMTVGARIDYQDSQYLNDLADAAANAQPVNYDGAQLKSEAQLLGAAIGEFGLSFAKRVELFGQDVSLGITPKYVQVETIYYASRIDNVDVDEVDADDYRTSHGGFNLDIGLLKEFENGVYTGLVAKNLIGRDYDTVALNGVAHTISLRPQLRAGIGYDGGWFRLAADADLTKNKPLAFEDGSRYVAVGAELSALGWAQLRAGYRFDTVDSDRNVVSVGFGLSPFKVVHFDLAVAGNSNEIGASAQLALTF